VDIPNAQLPSSAHDILPFDIDKDQKTDLVYVFVDTGGKNKIGWFQQGSSYAGAWQEYAIDTGPVLTNAGKIHGGIAPAGICDLDGDNYPDVIAPGRWYENPQTFASPTAEWKKHYMTDTGTWWGDPLIGQKDFAWGYMVRSWCADMDGDGDEDIVQSEGDYRNGILKQGNGRVGWLENSGGGQFQNVHWIKKDCLLSEPMHDFHSLGVFDYDEDGDLDVMSADGALPYGDGKKKAVYIFENTAPNKNVKPTYQFWKQHTMLLGYECHDAKIGDVNGDKKIDIVCRGYQYNDSLNPDDPPYLFLKNETP
jgi:FG-GAP-like repeat